MIMPNKYDNPKEEQQMVNEPAVAYSYNECCANVMYASDRGTLDTAITGEELRNRLHMSLMSRF